MAAKRWTRKRRAGRAGLPAVARILGQYAGRWAGTGRRVARGLRRKRTGGRR